MIITAKKKYYVRIKAYKTGKVEGRSKTVYSDWSESKNAQVKK